MTNTNADAADGLYFLDCERRWLLLARGYELAVRIEALARGTPAVPVGQIKAAA